MRQFIWPAVLFGLIWIAAFAFVVASGDRDPVEPLLSLALFGLLIPAIVHFLTRGADPLPTTEEVSWLEPFALLLLVGVIALFFFFSGRAPGEIAEAVWPGSEPARMLVRAAFNIFFFVIVPFGVMSVVIRHPLSSFGWHSPFWRMLSPRHLAVLLIVGGGMAAFQVFVAPVGARLREAGLAMDQVLVAGPVVFLWLMLTAGLTQEFFFRGVLQSRAARLLGNEWAGLFLAALVAGVIYLPGQIARAMEMGIEPGLFAANSVLIGSVSALMFGYVWLRTRNLLLLMLLNGAIALPASLIPVGRAFGLI